MWSLFRRNARPGKPVRRTSPSVRPRLEALEDRCLLSSPGTLDTTFGSGGIVTTSFGTQSNDMAFGAAVQSDGKVVAAGTSYTSNGSYYLDLTRYNANGTLDSSFGSSGKVQTKMPNLGGGSLLIQPDGKIVILSAVNNGFELFRYNTNGTLDKTFNSTGMVNTTFPSYSIDRADSLGLESVNGVTEIVAAGSVYPTGTTSPSYIALARYNLNGSLDTSFGNGGEVVSSFVGGGPNGPGFVALAIQGDSKIVVAGSSATNDFLVARYDTSGNLDPTFGNAGVSATVSGWATSVVVQPDGKIVAAGRTDYSGSGWRWGLERLNGDGSMDTTFGTNGVVEGPDSVAIRALALQTNGKLVAAGDDNSAGFHVVRYNADGSLDTGFGTGGQVTTTINGRGNAQALTLQANGEIIAAGVAPKSTKNTNYEFALIRYWGDTVPVIGSFTANPNPVTAGSSVTLTASNITDGNPNVSITQVAIYLDSNQDGTLEPGTDQLLGYATQTSPGVWTLTNSSAFGLTAGTYKLFAQAEDSDGVYSDPVALTLTVQ
jgi:uncharacterized delta-60 repeat protein